MSNRSKKTKNKIFILALLFTVLLALIIYLSISGIFLKQNQSGSTVIEPEITPEYLMTEYADMLENQGAVITITTLTKFSEGNEAGYYETVLNGKEVVESPDEPGGYYLANTNTALPVIIDPSTRIVMGDDKASQVMTTEEFVSLQGASTPSDNTTDDELSEEELKEREDNSVLLERNFKVYTIGTQTVLIIPFIYEKEGDSNV